jgi:hypothetical protein
MPRKKPAQKPPKTRTITVTVDEAAFGRLRSQCIIRYMMGMFGPQDEFVTRVVRAMEAGEKELVLESKGKPK